MTAKPRARWLIWGLIGGIIAVAAWRYVAGTGTRGELPIYGSVPSFSLVERSEGPLRSVDLLGRVWVADFIFTRCAGTCPALGTALAALLRRLSERGIGDVLAVSFSVDPTHDDPATLRRYAERFGADPARWLFVTGDATAISRLVRDGFKLGTTPPPSGDEAIGQEPITHSDRFVLVDARLQIRGYYHGIDVEGVAQLERDLIRLLGRHP